MQRLLLTLAFLTFAFCRVIIAQQTAEAAPADEPASQQEKQQEEFLRVQESDGEPVALQTAIASYHAPAGSPHAGARVDLVGAVHIGEQDYYEQLDEMFQQYDVVLYELVAPEGTRVEPDEAHAGRHPIGALQVGMRDVLELEFQLEQIDYSAPNFRHADMSPEEFSEDMRRRGDSLLKMAFRMMGAGIAAQGNAPAANDAALLMALLSPNRAKDLKRVMAAQFREMDAAMAGIADAEGRSTIITERNAKAFDVLEDELQKGKKKIAIFYGAGHLDDMAQRLKSDFGFTTGEKKWLTAWDLTE